MQPRHTCRNRIEANKKYPLIVSAESGWYWIDPDGPAYGGGAIYVHCDMTSGRTDGKCSKSNKESQLNCNERKGTTSIDHDSESATDVGLDPGRYSRNVTYNAPIRQVISLVALSQSINVN